MDYREAYYRFQATQDASVDRSALQRRFTKAARYYTRLLKGVLPASREAAILDVACGRGNFLHFFRRLAYSNALGVDSNPARVAIARSLGLNAVEGDAFELLAEKENQLDVVSALDFLEHLKKAELLRFLELASKALRPGGVIVLRTACADGPFGACSRYNDLTHEQAFTSGLARQLLEMRGFERVRVIEESPQAYNLTNAIRRLIFVITRPIANLLLVLVGVGKPAIWSRNMWCVGYKPSKQDQEAIRP